LEETREDREPEAENIGAAPDRVRGDEVKNERDSCVKPQPDRRADETRIQHANKDRLGLSKGDLFNRSSMKSYRKPS
jgi:hypothetical protein